MLLWASGVADAGVGGGGRGGVAEIFSKANSVVRRGRLVAACSCWRARGWMLSIIHEVGVQPEMIV